MIALDGLGVVKVLCEEPAVGGEVERVLSVPIGMSVPPTD